MRSQLFCESYNLTRTWPFYLPAIHHYNSFFATIHSIKPTFRANVRWYITARAAVESTPTVWAPRHLCAPGTCCGSFNLKNYFFVSIIWKIKQSKWGLPASCVNFWERLSVSTLLLIVYLSSMGGNGILWRKGKMHKTFFTWSKFSYSFCYYINLVTISYNKKLLATCILSSLKTIVFEF